MKVGCLVIATSLLKKKNVLTQTINSMDEADKYANLFYKKVLAVDDFGNNEIDFEQFRTAGWEVAIAPRAGEALNQHKGLKLLSDCDYVYFNNDDNFVKQLPTKEDMVKLDRHIVDGKKCGYVDMTFKGYNYRDMPPLREHLLDESNYIYANNGSVFVIKKESLLELKPYFIHGPIMIMPYEVMMSIVEYALANYKREHTEQAYCKAYLDLGYNETYYQTSYHRNPLDFEVLIPHRNIIDFFQANMIYHYEIERIHVDGGHMFNE
jgi:hypothetical protein